MTFIEIASNIPCPTVFSPGGRCHCLPLLSPLSLYWQILHCGQALAAFAVAVGGSKRPMPPSWRVWNQDVTKLKKGGVGSRRQLGTLSPPQSASTVLKIPKLVLPPTLWNLTITTQTTCCNIDSHMGISRIICMSTCNWCWEDFFSWFRKHAIIEKVWSRVLCWSLQTYKLVISLSN